MILIQKTFLYKNLRKTSKKYKKQTFYNKTTKKFFYNIIIMIQKSCNVEPKTRALDSDSPSYAILQSNVEAMISNHYSCSEFANSFSFLALNELKEFRKRKALHKIQDFQENSPNAHKIFEENGGEVGQGQGEHYYSTDEGIIIDKDIEYN